MFRQSTLWHFKHLIDAHQIPLIVYLSLNRLLIIAHRLIMKTRFFHNFFFFLHEMEKGRSMRTLYIGIDIEQVIFIDFAMFDFNAIVLVCFEPRRWSLVYHTTPIIVACFSEHHSINGSSYDSVPSASHRRPISVPSASRLRLVHCVLWWRYDWH